MQSSGTAPRTIRGAAIWAAVVIAVCAPIAAAAASPFLAWRDPIYIAAGFAGIIGLALMVFQPLLVAGYLPALSVRRGRLIHRGVGAALLVAVIIHVAGLWVTSPPDVIDALLFRSPTAFSAWGVIAMWAVFASALLAVMRRRLRLSPRTWRRTHTALAAVIVSGTVVHALLIEGAMETVTKVGLCVLVAGAAAKVIFDLRAWVWRSR